MQTPTAWRGGAISYVGSRRGVCWDSRRRSSTGKSSNLCGIARLLSRPSFLTLPRLHPLRRLDPGFSLYKKLFDRNATLQLIGRTALESYEHACRKLVDELGLENSVHFRGRVSDEELGQAYQQADVFVCMSEHEGVGLPLLESMHTGLPIVAFGAAAVPETAGDGGIVLPKKKPATVAAAAHKIITDKTLQTTLTNNAKHHLQHFDYNAAKTAWIREIAAL
jgi:glycosyltransferase involved in cell wall biosynthesis